MAKTLNRRRKELRKEQREKDVCVTIRFRPEQWALVIAAKDKMKLSTASAFVKQAVGFAAEAVLKGKR